MKLHRVWAVVMLCLVAPNLSAQMYKWVDKDGNLHFSDRPPPGAATPAPATKPAPSKSTDARDRVKNSQQDTRSRFNQTTTYPPSITLQMRALLHERKFAELNQRLADYHTATMTDIANEDALLIAYRAFDTSVPSLEPLIEAWVTATPDAYQPYLARAMYYHAKAWEARGEKWASETEQKQFDAMNAYFKKVSDDLAVVLEKNKQVLISYYLLVRMMKTSKDNKGILQVLQTAIDINPNTYHVRRMAMYAFTPRWGGSYEIMQALAEEAKQHSAANPRLKHLEGEIYREIAITKRRMDKYNEADELFNKALEFGEEALFLYDRGRNNFSRERYNEALQDLNRAIDLNHEAAAFYNRRARTFVELNNFTQAIDDIKRAIQLEPVDTDNVKFKDWIVSELRSIGYKQYTKGDIASSINSFNTALTANPNDASLYHRRAWSYIELNKLDRALSDIKLAIALSPDDYNYYLTLDSILVKRRDWGQIISYWDQYIARNPDNSKAYVERGGSYYHKGDIRSAIDNAKTAADMGNIQGKELYEKFKGLVK